ncbi:MAG: hypothetical protein P8J34_08050 [Flavobacteriales bacterium]|nr:hypothetical protein [Flavobacteriales bacterium]
MKKITFLFLLSSILFSSCETDFTVNADWKEVTVVYGLLDQSQEKQYIRINKAFLGNENAYVMASVADSINYNPNNLEVKIEKLSASGNVLATKILTDTIMFKEDGLFSVEENIIYVFDTDNFLNEEKEYKLTITNKNSGNIISSQTKLIHNLSLMSAFNNSAYKMGFYSQTGDFSNTTIEWTHSKNAAIYQMTLFVSYTEYGADTIVKTVQKVYPIIEYDGNPNMSQQITGEEFFNLLAYNIPSSTTVNRRINNLDVLFSVGTADLNTYINLNEPPTGIVQERDLFTNIDGGIGLFTARYNKMQENIFLTTTTKEAIATHLDSLNFIFP